MLSTEVRKKAEFICLRIAKNHKVEIKDMIWIQKWAKSNHSVESMLRIARRKGLSADKKPEGLDKFLQDMDLGDDFEGNGMDAPTDPLNIAAWFASKPRWFVDDEGCRD